MLSAFDLKASELRLGANNYKPLDVVLTRGEGVWVWDVDGNRYLDCLSAYSAVNQGHCHPRIVAAMVDQATRVSLTSRAFYASIFGEYAQFITKLFKYDKVLPMNTGQFPLPFITGGFQRVHTTDREGEPHV